jgi:rod shape-determining protein MreC
MPLGTLDRSAPSFFRQGPSPLSRLALYSALALFLMVADARFHVTEPLRKGVATVLYPLQWLMLPSCANCSLCASACRPLPRPHR